MKAYSLDLRERVVVAVEAGELSRHRIAKVFGVSYTWIKELFRRKRETGSIAPLPHGGGQKPLLDEEGLQRLREEVARHPDATLKELCERVRGNEGRRLSVPTMCRVLCELGLSRKKESALRHRARSSRTRQALATHGGAQTRRATAHLH